MTHQRLRFSPAGLAVSPLAAAGLFPVECMTLGGAATAGLRPRLIGCRPYGAGWNVERRCDRGLTPTANRVPPLRGSMGCWEALRPWACVHG
ncbi:MAG: hypothetical protein IKC19_08040 [Bacteroidales bacterium]|nr:hypothetical protein [Bacteroidales bacterium]